MGIARHLLLLSLAIAVAYALDAPTGCLMFMDNDTVLQMEDFNQTSRMGNLRRFCQAGALEIRREHFWCGGYIDEDGITIENTSPFDAPSDDGYWSIFLQYPVLSWMDVARKAQVMERIQEVARIPGGDCNNIDYTRFCVANVDTFDVTEYKESVLIHLFNLGVDGETFQTCFSDGMDSSEANSLIVRFRSRPAFNLTLNVDLLDMFRLNIGPASSIGDESRDPTLRPIILGSWAGNVTLDDARDDTSDGDFGTNPNPINYGLEAGDIVFAFFGSVLLVILGFIIVLGYFIHPFFLA